MKPEPFPSCTGAILAGGRSRRMGRTKALLPLPDGRTMIEHVARTVSTVCRNVVILGDPRVLPDLTHIPDLRSDHGPLAGIEALLASTLDACYLVCACDTPLLSTGLLRSLITAPPSAATILEDDSGAMSPLPMRITTDALDAVRTQLDQGRRALHALVQALGAQKVSVGAEQAVGLCNVNTREEYEQLVKRITAEGSRGES